MNKAPTPTNAQRLAGAFVEVNTCASLLLEMLDSLHNPEPVEGWRLEAMATHMELMVRRVGYVNQAAAHLACPGVLDAPDLADWMGGISVCLTPRTGEALPPAGARVQTTVEA